MSLKLDFKDILPCESELWRLFSNYERHCRWLLLLFVICYGAGNEVLKWTKIVFYRILKLNWDLKMLLNVTFTSVELLSKIH